MQKDTLVHEYFNGVDVGKQKLAKWGPTKKIKERDTYPTPGNPATRGY